MKLFRLILALTLVNVMAVFFAPSLKAQSQEKSQIVTEYNGKQYYIHTVKKKQSLKDIAKIYDVAKENNVVIYMLSFSEVAINIIVAESVANDFVNALHDKLVE